VRPVRFIDPQNNPLQHALKTYPILAVIWDLVPMGDDWFLVCALMSFMLWGGIGGMIVRYANTSAAGSEGPDTPLKKSAGDGPSGE
jgi:hypothetical protein